MNRRLLNHQAFNGSLHHQVFKRLLSHQTFTSLLVGGIFVLALVPRVVGTGAIVTVDEAYHWFDRVAKFWGAVSHAEYAHTNITGHPGVTTMWLGSLGRMAYLHLVRLGWVEEVTAGGYETPLYRTFLRFPLAWVSSLSVAFGYLLLRRLAGERVALLAAGFWATDPFLVAHGQLLHLDALLSAFITLSLLTAFLAFRFDLPALSPPPPLHWGWLVTSGVLGGFALLTKSPALILFPLVFLTAGISFLSRKSGMALDAPVGKRLQQGATQVMREVVLPLGGWAGMALVVWVGLWPAAWVDLPRAMARVVMQAKYEGSDPHGWGNFFLGQAVADPGPLFYPVALVLRLTPWTMLGLVAWGGSAWRALISRVRGSAGTLHGCHAALSRSHSWVCSWVGVLTCFSLLFLICMSILPKKFDRYLLPIFPALHVLAALGIVQVHRGILLTITLMMLAVGNLAWYHPYELAYYNPLVGGGGKAVQTIPVGWGEGYEQAGAFISAQYNGCERATATWFRPVLARSLCNHWVVPMDEVFVPGVIDYAVLYIDQIQRNNTPEATAWLRQHSSPLHIVRIHGIDYASIYQIPLPVEHPVSVWFGPAIELTGYELRRLDDQTLTLLVQWRPHQPISQDYLFFAHVVDGTGKRVAQIDVPPGGPRAPTSSWLLNSSITWTHPLPLPPDLAPGRYWIGIGVYDPENFVRLAVRGPQPQHDPPDDGPNVFMLTSFVQE